MRRRTERGTDCGPETGSTRQPQERQHSGAASAAGAGPSAPGEGLDIIAATIVTRKGRDRKGRGLGHASAR